MNRDTKYNIRLAASATVLGIAAPIYEIAFKRSPALGRLVFSVARAVADYVCPIETVIENTFGDVFKAAADGTLRGPQKTDLGTILGQVGFPPVNTKPGPGEKN